MSDQAKNLFAAIDLVRFPLRAKLSPQDLIRLVAPISACIDKATTGSMEYKWSDECQHALTTVQGHCLDIVEHIAITTDEITADEQHAPIIDCQGRSQATGTALQLGSFLALLMVRSTQLTVSLALILMTYVAMWPHKITTRTPKLGHTRVKS